MAMPMEKMVFNGSFEYLDSNQRSLPYSASFCIATRYQSRGPFLTSPLGANFDPQGRSCPQGRICPLGVKLSPGGEILCSPLHSSKRKGELPPRG
jgi:hypothetical protein